MRRVILMSALVLGGAACSTEKIADNTTDAVVFVGKTAVRGAAGAGKLAYRGAAAGVRTLRQPTEEYPAGTIVCLDDDGEIYSAAQQTVDGRTVCPEA